VWRWLALAAAGGVVAQGLRVEIAREPLPKTLPISEALPASISPFDPDDAYRDLISGDSTRVASAAKVLDVEMLVLPSPDFVRSIAANMDADPELERVLYIESHGRGIAFVFARRDGIWWQIGQFICGVPRGRCPGEFVELKQTVWYGTNDIVVHANVIGGTDVSQNDVTIYRLFDGRLHPVLEIVESAYNMRGSELSRIRFHDPGHSSEQATMVIDRTTKRLGGKRTTECIPYKWNVEKFKSLPVPPTRALCAPRE
jgi:hypothetical protein